MATANKSSGSSSKGSSLGFQQRAQSWANTNPTRASTPSSSSSSGSSSSAKAPTVIAPSIMAMKQTSADSIKEIENMAKSENRMLTPTESKAIMGLKTGSYVAAGSGQTGSWKASTPTVSFSTPQVKTDAYLQRQSNLSANINNAMGITTKTNIEQPKILPTVVQPVNIGNILGPSLYPQKRTLSKGIMSGELIRPRTAIPSKSAFAVTQYPSQISFKGEIPIALKSMSIKDFLKKDMSSKI